MVCDRLQEFIVVSHRFWQPLDLRAQEACAFGGFQRYPDSSFRLLVIAVGVIVVNMCRS